MRHDAVTLADELIEHPHIRLGERNRQFQQVAYIIAVLEDVVIQRHVVVDGDTGELPVKSEVLGGEHQTAQRPTCNGVDMHVR